MCTRKRILWQNKKGSLVRTGYHLQTGDASFRISKLMLGTVGKGTETKTGNIIAHQLFGSATFRISSTVQVHGNGTEKNN